MSRSVDETYDLITRDLQETLGGDIIKKILTEGKTVKCYWGESLFDLGRGWILSCNN